MRTVTLPPVLEAVAGVGQDESVAFLASSLSAPVHAYLFVGPPGSGKRSLAIAFAAALLCPDGGCGHCRDCRLALGEKHPDLALVERSGASVRVDEAREVTRLSLRSPMERPRQVVVVTEMHLVDKAAPALLKTIEEPPDSTVFLLLADQIPLTLRTIASRCVLVELHGLADADVATALTRQGIDPETAARAASLAGGRLDRAELITRDPTWGDRRELWASVAHRLEPSGASVASLVDELVAAAEASAGPIREAHQQELVALTEAAKAAGERGVPGRAEIEDRHKRELRRARTDELRSGLAALAQSYGARLQHPNSAHVAAALEAVSIIERTSVSLIHNPNESLALQALLVRLAALEAGTELPPAREPRRPG